MVVLKIKGFLSKCFVQSTAEAVGEKIKDRGFGSWAMIVVENNDGTKTLHQYNELKDGTYVITTRPARRDYKGWPIKHLTPDDLIGSAKLGEEVEAMQPIHEFLKGTIPSVRRTIVDRAIRAFEVLSYG